MNSAPARSLRMIYFQIAEHREATHVRGLAA
jgi:hypothetical protein